MGLDADFRITELKNWFHIELGLFSTIIYLEGVSGWFKLGLDSPQRLRLIEGPEDPWKTINTLLYPTLRGSKNISTIEESP